MAISTSDYLKAFTASIPRNAYGLPEGIYRPDLLPALPTEKSKPPLITFNDIPTIPTDTATGDTLAEDSTSSASPSNITDYNYAIPAPIAFGKYASVARQVGLSAHALDPFEDEIDLAFVSLDYAEGFPCINGKPFWMQLDFEAANAFLNFEAYLRQPATNSVRQLFTLVTPSNASLPELQEQAALYYWHERAKSHDVFNVVQRRRERERQAINIENQHLVMGNRLMAICEEYLDANAEELQETLSPKNFVEMLKVAASLQRISVGLPANGPSGTSATSPADAPKSVEVILRQIADMNNVPNTNGDNSSQAAEKAAQNNLLSSLLADPDTLRLAQELIVRVVK